MLIKFVKNVKNNYIFFGEFEKKKMFKLIIFVFEFFLICYSKQIKKKGNLVVILIFYNFIIQLVYKKGLLCYLDFINILF